MAIPSVEKRIIRELSRRGTCSLLDLKSALRLSRGDIMGVTARLADLRSVRIETDHQGEHINYTWAGPKEKAPGGKSSPAKKPLASPNHSQGPPAGGGRKTKNTHHDQPTPKNKWKELAAEKILECCRIGQNIVDIDRGASSPDYASPLKENSIAILRHPKTEEAYKYIFEATGGTEYELFFSVVILCAVTISPKSPSRFLSDNKKEVERYVAAAQSLSEGIKELLHPRFPEVWPNQDVIYRIANKISSRKCNESKAVKDVDILYHIEILRDALSCLSVNLSKIGKKTEWVRNNLILTLANQFKKDINKPLYPAIAALLQATHGETYKPESIKAIVSKLRRRATLDSKG